MIFGLINGALGFPKPPTGFVYHFKPTPTAVNVCGFEPWQIFKLLTVGLGGVGNTTTFVVAGAE